MKEQIETTLCDDRIEEIRLNYERKVMERFIENYIKGLRNFEIIETGVDARTGKPAFVVQSLDSTTRYFIRSWNCSCNELEKTGVGCSHLLLAATMTADKSYAELMSPRWKKKPLQLEKTPIKYRLRRGTEMSPKRNTLKRRRKVGRK